MSRADQWPAGRCNGGLTKWGVDPRALFPEDRRQAAERLEETIFET